MGIKERKEREREEMRELILNTAEEIVKTEGLDKLSIRKIAGRIDYSPAIIYHYFQDKEDIVNHLMKKGYERIIKELTYVMQSNDTPQQRLEKLVRAYIDTALKMPEEYKNIQLNSSPEALNFTASLFKGASTQKPALAILCQCLKELYANIDDDVVERTAQVIYTASFGLIIRLIIESGIDEEQKSNLIEHHLRCIVNGIVLGKPLDH